MQLDFWFDLDSPESWLSTLEIEAHAARAGATLSWRPLRRARIAQGHRNAVDPAAGQAAAKRALLAKDAHRLAAVRGRRFVWDAGPAPDTAFAVQVIAGAPPPARPALARALGDRLWALGQALDAPAVRAHAAAAGLDAAACAAAGDAALEANHAEATARGVFDVPTVTGDGRLWFGLDRLGAAAADWGAPPAAALPTGGPGGDVQLFHDFASPFSSLGVLAAAGLEAAHGVRVRVRPLLLGALFRQLGTPMVPLFAMDAPRQRWMMADLLAQAEALGFPLAFPDCFPVRTVLPLRVALVEPAVTVPLIHALWAHNVNIGEPGPLREALDGAGFDGAALLAAADAPAVKAALIDNGEAALRQGVIGLPGWVLPDGMVFWGVDRIPLVRAGLAGFPWPPEAR